MEFVTVVPGMAGRFRDMLEDGAAQADVDDLHPLADAKDRALPFEKKLQGLELRDIQFDVDIPGALVFLSEESRGNIAAPRQQQAVERRQALNVHTGQALGAHLPQGVFIVGGVFCPAYDGDFYRVGSWLHNTFPFLLLTIASFNRFLL